MIKCTFALLLVGSMFYITFRIESFHDCNGTSIRE